MRLFCDCKTDEEKSNFFLSGRAVETGVIAPAISNEVAMAYYRCAQLKKENDALRARIEAMERQRPVRLVFKSDELDEQIKRATDPVWAEAFEVPEGMVPLYALSGAKGE